MKYEQINALRESVDIAFAATNGAAATLREEHSPHANIMADGLERSMWNVLHKLAAVDVNTAENITPAANSQTASPRPADPELLRTLYNYRDKVAMLITSNAALRQFIEEQTSVYGYTEALIRGAREIEHEVIRMEQALPEL